MTADQIAALARAARLLRSDARSLRAGREGASGIRCALATLVDPNAGTRHAEAETMARAALKAYDRGDDRSAAGHADEAARRLEAFVASAGDE